MRFSIIVKADRAQGHSEFWVHDLSALFKTMEQGVATHVFAAFHPSISATGKLFYSCHTFITLTTILCVVNNGSFLQDSHVTPLEDMYPLGRDPIDAEKLWALSEKIVGEKFDY